MGGRCDRQPDCAGEFPGDENAENPCIIKVIVLVAQPPAEIGRDGIFRQVTVVAEAVDSLAFFVGDRLSVIDAVDERTDTLCEISRFMRVRNRTHFCLAMPDLRYRDPPHTKLPRYSP